MESSSSNPSARRSIFGKLLRTDKRKEARASDASGVSGSSQIADPTDPSQTAIASGASQLVTDFAKLADNCVPLQAPSGIGYSQMKTVLQGLVSLADGAFHVPGLKAAFQLGLQIVQTAEMAKDNKQTCFNVAHNAYELLRVVNDMSIPDDPNIQDITNSLT
ncbi:hypothetical protein AX17_007535, partial [Amanita inopinata Kibby_2008]